MVHDAARNMIYITNGGNVLRYHVPSQTFVDPITLGGSLTGIDLSPDGKMLAVADRTHGTTESWVHLVRLNDLVATKASIAKESTYEHGTWSVAFGADGNLLVSHHTDGSGWLPLRHLNLATMSWTKLLSGIAPTNSFSHDTMLSASGDRKIIVFGEPNSSDGKWGTYNVATGGIVRRQGYTDGTSWFNFEVGANVDGTQYTFPTYGGTFIYNGAYSKIATLGSYATQIAVGVAYHPVEPLIYLPWMQTREVRAYSSSTFQQVGTYDFEDTFQWNGHRAYTQGRTKLSRDGSLLMVTVAGGVRFVQMYAPLTASEVTGTTSGNSVTLGLKGAIGNGGTLSYSLVTDPTKGVATINGNYLVFTPAAGFSGTDTFRYAAKYGSVTAESTVTVSYLQPNRAPVANADSAVTVKNVPVAIPVLVNDTDADGDALSVTMVTKPANGSVTVSGSQIVFTPVRNFTGSTAFIYTVTDGKGGSASATVSLIVNKR